MGVIITEFCKRQFEHNASGTKITSTSPEDFERLLDDMYGDVITEKLGLLSETVSSVDSPMVRVENSDKPHCKYVIIDNFTNARVGTMQITNENYQYLRSGYSARREGELPVLSRWFELPMNPPKAKYLVLVLYSREQLEMEHNEFPETAGTPFEMDSDWGVVAILGQRYRKVEPKVPVTEMRNALPLEEGGNNTPLDKEYYERSVSFWSNNAVVKQR